MLQRRLAGAEADKKRSDWDTGWRCAADKSLTKHRRALAACRLQWIHSERPKADEYSGRVDWETGRRVWPLSRMLRWWAAGEAAGGATVLAEFIEPVYFGACLRIAGAGILLCHVMSYERIHRYLSPISSISTR